MTIGLDLPSEDLVLTKGRDFRWGFQNLDATGTPVNFPPGSLYFELDTKPTKTIWTFTIDEDIASLKVESTAVDAIPKRTPWQLVWLPTGEAAGGDPIALGLVRILS